jgi:hypothetical protein
MTAKKCCHSATAMVVTPPDTEFRIGIPGWIASFEGDFGVRGVVTDQEVDFTGYSNAWT